MTISSRTRTYRACWILALVFAAVSATAFLRLGPDALTGAGRLPGYPAHGRGMEILARYPGALPVAAAVLCSAYGIVVLFLLSFRYSRTVSMELYFFAFWALALAAEALRVESLRGALLGASFPERSIVTRLLLSMRFLGIFSLFAGSLYSVGYSEDKQSVPIGAVLLASLALGTGLPINTGIFGADLLQRVGYTQLYGFLYAACLLGASANYALAARLTGEKGYNLAALGNALIFVGGLALRASRSPGTVILGTLGLAAGTVLFLRKIHAYYLWL
ncbi:MAG TPA: hypothetical protein P5117_09275 [Spirochaetia bacterium]|nr:hypothetical protein [Spirochaetales bacterium]HRY79490.1 hypothetical protein [Spirochaetia bacterium]HRZ89659.1 hypothetical protein [Spirochaetia bacterium]